MFPLQNLFSVAWYFSAIRNTKWVGGMGRHSKTESFVQLPSIAEPALLSCSLDLLPGSATPLFSPSPLRAARDYLGKQKPCKGLNSRLSGSFPGCCVKLTNYPLPLASNSDSRLPHCTVHTPRSRGGAPGICHQNEPRLKKEKDPILWPDKRTQRTHRQTPNKCCSEFKPNIAQ